MRDVSARTEVATMTGRQVGRDPRPVARWVDGLIGIGWVTALALSLVLVALLAALIVVEVVVQGSR